MMILLGNKQNSLILLGFFPFSWMEIPVYSLGECTPWGRMYIETQQEAVERHSPRNCKGGQVCTL